MEKLIGYEKIKEHYVIEGVLKKQYGLEVTSMEKSKVGAGSDTWFVNCTQGRFVLKYPCESEINHPQSEPQLCEYLLDKGVSVCQFIKNKQGTFFTEDEMGHVFHLQRFIEGKVYEFNSAPSWLLKESAQMLGKIHSALKDYTGLPEGIGEGFFRYMTPENALKSYHNSLQIARKNGNAEVIVELQYRIGLIKRFPKYSFDLTKLTCQATHGDFFISQLICGQEKIEAVIDWTTACVHPIVWEILRSYVYASPKCKEGQIDIEEFIEYVGAYREYAVLNEYDLQCMVSLFYYQLVVCDYYGQYYSSDADNRYIYLHQARFSTKLLRWFEEHGEELTKAFKR